MNNKYKLFVVSDIHSFYEPFKKALDAAGFDPSNPQHWLISAGDCFDRGPDSEKLLHFLMQLERKVLVKGNHDLLLDDLCMRGFPYSHDKQNGTTRTVQDISGKQSAYDFHSACEITWNKLARYRELLVNYFETERYIFIHSWIPTEIIYDEGASKPWHKIVKHQSYKEDWRSATEAEWEESMWGNPFDKAFEGLNKTGKTLVFGHWHCSYGHKLRAAETNNLTSEFEESAIWEPYIDDEYNIIGVDRCTAHTGEVNILVLEDNFI